MSFFTSRRRFAPHPIAHYALALSLILVLALAVLAAAVLHDTARLKVEVSRSDEKLARQELDEAISLLTEHARSSAQLLMAWDEARQQLENPIYYGYWRNSRALSAGVIPETVDAVDLYGVDGHNLSHATTEEAVMPVTLNAQNLQPYMVQENGHGHVYYFFPFYQGVDREHLLGYMGLKFDLRNELMQLRKFRYLDLESIRIEVKEGQSIPLQKVVSTLKFETIANPETRATSEKRPRSLRSQRAEIASRYRAISSTT